MSAVDTISVVIFLLFCVARVCGRQDINTYTISCRYSRKRCSSRVDSVCGRSQVLLTN